jgi:hypothetical protein
VWGLGCVFEYLLTGDNIFKFKYDGKVDKDNLMRKKNLLAIFNRIGIPNNENF